MNLISVLHKTIKKCPNKTALIQDDTKISYEEFWDKVERIGNALQSRFQKGDKIAIMLPNCKEFIYCSFAIIKSNLVFIPLKKELSHHELKYMIENSKPDAIITNSEIYWKFKELLMLITNIIVDGFTEIDNEYNDCITMEELYQIGNNSMPTKNYLSSSLLASINYTYIGKGIPIGAMLTHRNYIYAASAVIKLHKIDPTIKLLLVLPMYHIFGLTVGVIVPLLVGGTVIIENSLKPTKIFKDIEAYNINALLGMPSIYALLVDYYNKKKYDLDSLTLCISGGSYMTSELYENIKKVMGIDILQGYGLTECFPIICNNYQHNIPGTLGIPAHRVKVKLHNKDNNQVGELLVNSPTTMLGYYNQKEITKDVLKNGWFYTGDYAEIDSATGHILFRGIKKSIVKVNGYTVDLVEVRNVLLSHPSIIDAKYCGNDNALTESPLIFEITINSDCVTERDIKDFCGKRLAKYKIPKIIRIKDVVYTNAAI